MKIKRGKQQRHDPLDIQMTKDLLVDYRDGKTRSKFKDREEKRMVAGDGLMDSKSSKKILEEAQSQLEEIKREEAENAFLEIEAVEDFAVDQFVDVNDDICSNDSGSDDEDDYENWQVEFVSI
jgi:hypothetical protein